MAERFDDERWGWIVDNRPGYPHMSWVTLYPAGVHNAGAVLLYASIDWRKRAYEIGWTYAVKESQPGEGKRAYRGRGWRVRLTQDAVAALKKIQEGDARP